MTPSSRWLLLLLEKRGGEKEGHGNGWSTFLLVNVQEYWTSTSLRGVFPGFRAREPELLPLRFLPRRLRMDGPYGRAVLNFEPAMGILGSTMLRADHDTAGAAERADRWGS